jgi:hypothetical protein
MSAKQRGGAFVWVIVIVVLIAAGGVWLWKGRSTADGGDVAVTWKTRLEKLRISVIESGQLKASKSTDIYCEVKGGATILYLVPEGTQVNAGDLLVRLDASTLENDLTAQRIKWEQANAAGLADELRPALAEIRSIKVALNAGNRNSAGVSTIATILSYVGLPVQVWKEGEWRTMRGWSAGEFVMFPAPVGRRRVQLCDVPDLTLFPKRFQADNVIFKAGVELTILNYAIGLFGQVRRIFPSLNLPALARPLVTFSKLFKPLGTLHGGCGVWVTDVNGRQESLAVIAHENGPRIPGSPAILLAQKLLTGQTKDVGAFPCMGFLNMAEFAEFLAPYNVFVKRCSDNT